MKRHVSLEPFSRDHNGGLILARRMGLLVADDETALAEMRSDFLAAWHLEMADHFNEEERLLGCLAGDGDGARLAAEHDAIRAQVARWESGDLKLEEVHAIGQALHDHIRWEERELFPHIEQRQPAEVLEALIAETDVVELRRHTHDPDRQKLVLRRMAQRPQAT